MRTTNTKGYITYPASYEERSEFFSEVTGGRAPCSCDLISPNQCRVEKFLISNRHGGFTLLEVMVAIAIIATALMAVFGSQSQSLSLASETKFSTTAILLAQQRMAELEAMDPEELLADSGDFEEDFPDYRWEMKVSDVASVEPEEVSDYLKQIDLTVSWGEDGPFQYSLRLYRFVPKGG